MKKLITAFVILLVSLNLSAQYKKASFFGKEGRTYELAAHMYALGDGKGSPIGIKAAFGRDQDGKRFFSSWEFQYIPSYAYKFRTTDINSGDPVDVAGKSKATFIYALNYGFHLLNNDPEKKIKPFVAAGLNIVLSTGVKTVVTTPEWAYDLKKQVADEQFNGGLQGGIGCLINFTSKLGLKLQGGYAYQFQFNSDKPEGIKLYYMFTSHPYASAGVRLRLAAE